ncbi:hypothetical protein [Shewanella surugensis]|uniref:Uncharacterized protein n=1 Tax=Shewanella surugensis TaxID=212020 RepID=A0ABT0LBZ2_9GAMM|nr:hypothetical protein [Shewanella surugensis]MCL1125223.1 hypothetical protein [Shewanella surugensis]
MMSDLADDAQRLMQWRIKSSLSQLTTVITCSTGRCYYCFEVIGMEQRFCDSYCRDDHERIQRLEQVRFGKRAFGSDALRLEAING